MSAEAIGEPGTTPADPRRWRMLALLGVAQFMLILDVPQRPQHPEPHRPNLSPGRTLRPPAFRVPGEMVRCAGAVWGHGDGVCGEVGCRR